MATPKKRTKRGWQRDRTGCVVVQFTALDGKRRTLRFGNIPDKDAIRHVSMLQALIATLNVGGTSDAKLTSQIESWLTGIGPKIGDKLVEFGLLRPVAETESTQLGPFLDRYLALRTDVKPTTATAFTFTQRNLVAFFGYDRDLTTINKLEAREFRAHLQKTKLDGGESLAANTMRRRVTMASQFFNAAVEAGIIEKNPFRGVGEAVRANKARMYFLTVDDAAKVLAACPSAEWKLVFGLARWGGLRIPSEINELKWEDFDWAGGKFLVHSPKTEHHEGKECRWVPIFDELYPIVREAWEKAEPGDVYVLNRYRNHTNLATGFKIIVKRAGLKQWPKTFQNLRSTRETELMAVHPIDKVCEWIGNTPLIAMKHYKQQRDEDFIQVARLATDAKRGPGQSLAMALQSGSDGEGQDGSGELASVGAESENYESSAISGPAVESGRATVYDANILLKTAESANSVASSCNPLATGQPAGPEVGEVAELTALAATLPPQALGELLAVARALAADAARTSAAEMQP